MQIFLTAIAVIIRITSNSLTNVFQKKLTLYRENPVSVNCINYLILSCLSIPLLYFIDFSQLNRNFWLYATCGGICGALCNCFMVMALKRGELSVLGPINSYKAIIGLIFGVLILHEIPNIYGFLGMLLIIFGSYFIFDEAGFGIFKRKDIKYRIYALIFSAIEAVFIKKVIILSSITTSFAASSFMGFLFSLFIMKYLYRTKFKLPETKSFQYYILTAICFALMTFSTAYVFKYLNVAYALSLFQLSIIINVILGYQLFREKKLIKKLIGSLIILIGSATIFIFGH